MDEFLSPFPGRSPEPVAKSYSELELLQLQDKFWPVANKYRKHRLVAILAFSVLALMILLNGLVLLVFNHSLNSTRAGTFIGVLCLLCGAVGVVAGLTLPALRCPSCGGFIDQGIARYCPHCGSEKLSSDWLGTPCCNDCGQQFRNERFRGGRFSSGYYKIHACTCCGAIIDPEGI